MSGAAIAVEPRRIRNVLEMLSFRAASLPMAFLTTVVTSRFLQPEGRGAYVIGLLTVTVVATFMGNATAVTYEVGRRPDMARQIVGRAIVLSATLGILGGAVLMPLVGTFSSGAPHSVILFPLGLPLLLVSQSIGGALAPLNRLRLLNVVQFVPPLVLLAGTATAVGFLGLGVEGAVGAWLAAQALAAAVALVGARDIWTLRGALSLGHTNSFVMLGVRAGIVNLVALVNYRIELMLLEAFRGLNAVGVYSVSVSLAELLWLFSGTLSAVTIAPALAAADDETSAAVIAQALRHTLIITIGAGIALGVLGAVLIPVVFGESFSGAIVPLIILIPGAIAYAPASVLSAFFSMRLGRLRYPVMAAGVSAAVTTLGCLALIPAFGSIGAAAASTIGYACGSILLSVVFARRGRLALRALVPISSDFAIYREVPAMLRRRLA
jgi:O-antigen/teichoic acid export membrane protein